MAKYVLRFIGEPASAPSKPVTKAYTASTAQPRTGRYLTRSNVHGHYSSADINDAHVFDDRWFSGRNSYVPIPAHLERIPVKVVARG
jgi:hypothetical protein